MSGPLPHRKFVLFALGFRPFFLLAALFAVLLMAVWIPAFLGGREFATYYGVTGWHSHEMIFGYTAAVVGGFLLTAVRNWTNLQTAAGPPLAGMATLWLLGRLMPFFPGALPPWVIAGVDIAFFPALAVAVAIPMVRSGQRRNLIFIPLLGALALANLAVHLELLGYAENTARAGNFLGLNLIVLLIVVMGGRVIPFFTERALQGVVPKRWPVVERLSPSSVIAFLVAELILPNSMIAGGLSALAALVHAIRLMGWYTHRFWSVPLLWVLHLGYGWVVVGFCLKALAAFGLISPQYAVHAFTVGGIGVLTLGMMARVSLGHTGRPLVAAAPVAFGFALVNLAAAARGVLPAVFPQWLPQLVALSGGLWIAAFLLFLAIYIPILTRPRVDGRPG